MFIKILCKQKSKVKKLFWSKKMFGLKQFWVQRNLEFKEIWVKKKFWVHRNLQFKEIQVQIIGLKTELSFKKFTQRFLIQTN